MATGSSSRDVILTLAVESLGEEGIKQLQTAINALAKEGGLAGPEFKQLADQISRLGEQNTAVQTIKKLADETEQLKSSQTDAAQKTSELGQRLEVLQQASSQAAEKQREAKDAVIAAKQELAIYSGEISKLRAEYDAAGKKTEEYQTKFKALIDKQTEGRTRLVELREEQKAATSEYDKAQSSVDRLAKEYDKSVQSVDKLTKAANDNSAALNAASEQAQKLGVATENITASEAELIDIFNRGVTAIEARKVAIAEMAESDRLLAIQEQRQIALLKQGEQALQAEVLALRDAERSNQEYAAAKAKATADEEAWQREAFAIVEAKEAAQKLAKETEVLVAAEQELAKQNAFEKLATEAQRLSQAAEYVRFWETELAKAEQQVKETAAAASQASAKIESAFKTVGVRSVQDLKEEIAKTKAAMETLASESAATGVTLKGAFDAGNAKINALERDLRELNGTMTLGDKTAKLFAGSMSQIAAGNLVADGVGYLVQKVKDLGAEFVQAVIKGDQMTRGLNAVYGSSELAAKQIDFLRQTAMDSGVSMGSLTSEFIKFSAAMKSANIPLDQSNELFKAVTRASASLGLSADETSGALNALAQMASKGVVSMEELRQQLGDRLPGAMGLVAQGLGITEQQLNKLVESGNLAARDLFPALSSALQKLQGDTDGVANAWERFKGFLTLTAQTAGDAGWVQLLTGGIKLLGGAVGAAGIALMGFYEALQLVIKAQVAWWDVITGGSAKTAWAFLKKEADDSATRLRGLHDVYGQLLDPQQKASDGNTKFGTSSSAAAPSVLQLEDATRRLAEGQNLSAAATKLAGDATLQAADKIVPYRAKAEELLKTQEQLTEGYQRKAKAAEEEGQQLVTLAKLTGDNAEIAKAEAEATRLQANALEEVAKSQQAEVDLLLVAKQHLEDVYRSRGLNEQQIKNETKAIDDKLAKAEPELQQMRAAANAAETEARARGIQTLALKDHSKEIGAYGQLLTALRATESQLIDLQKEGWNVGGDLKRVREEIGTATALYNDGVKDLIRNTNVELKQTEALTAQKDLESGSRIKHLETLKDEATRTGQINDVTKLENQIKTENIKILERRRGLADAEIDARLKILDAQRKLLTADTDENKAKRDLLDVEEKLLLARKDANKSIDEQIKGLKNEIKAVESLTAAYHQLGIKTPEELAQIADKNEKAWQKIKEDGRASVEQLKTAFEKYAQSVIDAAGDMGREMAESMLKGEAATRNLNVTIDQTGKVTVDAMGKASNAINNARGYMTAFERSALAATVALEAQNAEIERRISAQEKANELLERELELERKRLGVDKEGFRVDKDGNRIQIVTENKRTVYDKAKASGLTDAQALGIADRFINQYGYQIGSEQTGKPWSVAVQEAINDQVIKNARDSANQQQQQQQQQQRGGADTDTTRQQPRSTPRNDKTTVTINLANGASKRINTDPAGATALQEVLQSLETSSRTTL